MSNNALSPAGTASYSSDTMFVGDGTWDSERNTFLLPNLQGLNFATMQYNGMGNRFRDLPQYHVLIIGHGVLAAIVFIFMIPAAIFIARFWHSKSRQAFKLHVYIQILVVFLSTVILILGWFAVGPERSLTNPHHGIGVALYVCILAQFLWGWLMYKRERKRTSPPIKLPLRIHIHKLFGRSIAILGFVQIALGLTLYGSPKALFVLYALAGTLLLFLYMALAYQDMNRIRAGDHHRPPQSEYTDYDGSSYTATQTAATTQGGRPPHKEESHWARNLLAAGGAIGAYEWYKNRRDKKAQGKNDRYTQRPDSRLSRSSSGYDSRLQGPQRRPPGPPGPYGEPSQYESTYGPSYGPSGPSGVAPSGYTGGRPSSYGGRRDRHGSQSRFSEDTWMRSEEDEKHGQKPAASSWRDRLLGAGVGVAALVGVKSLFDRGKNREKEGHNGYRPPRGGDHSMVSQTDVSRIEAGEAPFSPPQNRRHQEVQSDTLTPMSPSRIAPKRRPSVYTIDESDDESQPPRRRPGADEGNTLKDSIAALGVIAGLREWNKSRKQRRLTEQAERIRQQEIEEERRYKRNSSHHYPLPEHAQGRRTSMSGTLMTGPEHTLDSNAGLSQQNFRPDTSQPPLPIGAGAVSPVANPLVTSTASPVPPTPIQNVFDAQQQHWAQQQQQQQGQPSAYNLPPPPPPPGATINQSRPAEYQAPPPGSLQMPQGAIEPDPSRLLSQQHLLNNPNAPAEGAVAAGLIGGALAQPRPPTHSSPRYNDSRTRLPQHNRQSSLGSNSVSQMGQSEAGPSTASGLPVSVKVKMHNDGRHVTLRRLNEQEAAAEREARRVGADAGGNGRRARRGSSLSSGGEDAGRSRFRRGTNSIRPSSQQPIAAVPPPPSMSSPSAAGSQRPPFASDLPLPTAGSSRIPQASASPPAAIAPGMGQPISPPPHQGLSPAPGPASSGAIISPGNITSDIGTGTDVSAFDNNRRRRRAERARRDAAAKGGRVEFE